MKLIFSLAGLLILFAGCDASSSRQSQQPNSAVTTSAQSKSEKNPEINELFESRLSAYNTQMASYQAAKEKVSEAKAAADDLRKQLDALEATKPDSIKYDRRKWQTIGGNHSVFAELVNANDSVAALKKDDGTTVNIQWKDLIAEDRVFIQTKLEEIKTQQEKIESFESKFSELQKEYDAANAEASLQLTEPTKPVYALVAAEYKTKEWKDKLAEAEREARRPKLDKSRWMRVREGMTFNEVVEIIGQPDAEVSSNQFGNLRTVMYSWKGKQLMQNANCTFQNGKLVAKAQFGL